MEDLTLGMPSYVSCVISPQPFETSFCLRGLHAKDGEETQETVVQGSYATRPHLRIARTAPLHGVRIVVLPHSFHRSGLACVRARSGYRLTIPPASRPSDRLRLHSTR